MQDMTIIQLLKLADAIRSDSPSAPASAPVDRGHQIVILDRGFVYVGRVTTDREWCTIRNANNVRRWGTTRGLGQLAAEGPQPDTVLDPSGTVRAPMRSVVAMIETENQKWK